jgi:hypothetical protein
MAHDTPERSALNLKVKTRFRGMAQVVPRRARGTSIDNIQAGYTIPPESKKFLADISLRMGISASEGLELVLRHVELADDGLPVWADREHIEEALPMAQAS